MKTLSVKAKTCCSIREVCTLADKKLPQKGNNAIQLQMHCHIETSNPQNDVIFSFHIILLTSKMTDLQLAAPNNIAIAALLGVLYLIFLSDGWRNKRDKQ